MFIITGSVASGTTLVSNYLHYLGINMSPELKGIGEDPRFYNMVMSWKPELRFSRNIFRSLVIPPQNRIEMIYLAKMVCNESELWGFKLPEAINYSGYFIDAFLKYTSDITLIHIFRNYHETVESWLRIPDNVEIGQIYQYILAYHLSALSTKVKWSGRITMHIVNVRDIIKNPRGFCHLIGVPYKDINAVINPKKLKPAIKSYSIYESQQKCIYDLLERVKWNP